MRTYSTRHRRNLPSGLASLWMFTVPLVMLPNPGFVLNTPFGLFMVVDLVLAPLLVSLALSSVPLVKLNIGKVTIAFSILFSWCLLALVVWSSENADRLDKAAVGGVKLIIIALWALAGVLLVRTISNPVQRERHYWVLSSSGIIASLSLIAVGRDGQRYYSGDWYVGFEASNAISVVLAMLLSYLGGAYLTRTAPQSWQKFFPVIAAIMMLGILGSGGRGGWLSLVIAAVYICWRVGLFSTRIIVAGVGGFLVLCVAFISQPAFRREVLRTLDPASIYITPDAYSGTVGGIDTGSRLTLLVEYLPRLLDAPTFGTGFRIPADLSTGGSHNFWLDMFLEAGWIGGGLSLLVIALMWLQASSRAARIQRVDVPVKAALVAAFVGGLTGDYFFAGYMVFFLVVSYGLVGSMVYELPDPEQERLPRKGIKKEHGKRLLTGPRSNTPYRRQMLHRP